MTLNDSTESSRGKWQIIDKNRGEEDNNKPMGLKMNGNLFIY